MKTLLPCPFCGTPPVEDQYPTMIRIYCPKCKLEGRHVEVVGHGLYSDWVSAQSPDEKGLVELSSRTNPTSNPERYKQAIALWNKRPGDAE